jgi:hypothetical protein
MRSANTFVDQLKTIKKKPYETLSLVERVFMSNSNKLIVYVQGNFGFLVLLSLKASIFSTSSFDKGVNHCILTYLLFLSAYSLARLFNIEIIFLIK